VLYGKLSVEYPHQERRTVHWIEITATRPDEPPVPQVRSQEQIYLLSEDRRSFVRVAPYLLAVHVVAPYPSWHEFSPKIDRAWQVLLAVVDVRAMQRIGLLYVNRFQLPSVNADLDTYLDFAPRLGSRLPQLMANFSVSCLLPFANGRDACQLQLASVLAETPRQTGIQLSLDFFLAQSEAVSPDETPGWVETAHDRIKDLFEGCITDALRRELGEEA
jgi:uncharacterized protein (TIGR04255 family)